jgi:hypothetical protein
MDHKLHAVVETVEQMWVVYHVAEPECVSPFSMFYSTVPHWTTPITTTPRDGGGGWGLQVMVCKLISWPGMVSGNAAPLVIVS